MPAKEVDAAAAARLRTVDSTRAGAPFVVLADRTDGGPMRIVVVASGALAPGDESWLDGADAVIAADGGAAALDRLGRRPDRVVGDLDSAPHALVERLVADGVRVDRHPVDKDASDTELAVRAAIDEGADRLDLLGATGGDRLDHELANLMLLADPAVAGIEVRAIVGSTIVRVVRGGERMALEGGRGDLVTLLPIAGDAEGVTASGLRWPLEAATLRMGRSRGLSNVIVDAGASVTLTAGLLLVIETRTTGDHP
jgi:thiamine pyrophosphokinase